MGNNHFLLYCDKPLADNAIQFVLDSDSNARVVSSKVVNTQTIDDTTDVYVIELDSERVHLAITVGDRNSPIGPYNGEYWINIAAEPTSFFRNKGDLATHIKCTLISHGARENRRR